MGLHESHFENVDAAAASLAEQIATVLQDAIDQRGQAVLAVSGGRTPIKVFHRLHDFSLDWSKVIVTLADERWVAPDHPDSNQRLCVNELLKDTAAEARFIPFYGDEATAFDGLSACEARIAELPEIDAIFLGMGEDGHFASLFPNDPALETREGRCVAVSAPTHRDPKVDRMSLTAPAIIDCHNIFLLLSGDEKLAKYEEAKQDGPVSELPLRLLTLNPDCEMTVLIAD